MSAIFRCRAIVTAGLFLALVSGAAAEDGRVSNPAAHVETGTYVFSPDQSTLVQIGGIAGVHWTYCVQGQFQLIVDRDAKTASFAHVDANATDANSPQRALDPNQVFNLTLLVGTTVDDKTISFTGKTSDSSDVRITVTLQEGLVRLVGRTTPPPTGRDFFIFGLDAVAQRKYGGGTGEPNNPYQIATAADLLALGETPADYDKHFLLTADIDLDPKLPGGKVFDNAVIAGAWKLPFTGVFDGNGHTISRLTIVGEFSLGLFGQLGWNFQGQSSGEPTCTVTNLAVEDVNIVGSVISAGALAAYAEWAVVSHSSSTGKVSGKGTVGGLVGDNRHAVINCQSGCTVTGDSDVGGLVGNNNGSVTNCCSTGTVNGGSSVGGLVGRHRGSITQSCSTGGVSGKDAVAGLVGRNGICSMLHRLLRPGDIHRSYSAGAVKGETSVGGLIGEDNYGSIRQCYSTGAVSGSAQVDGLLSGRAPAMDVTAIFDVTASFWDVETSGLTISSGGQGKTTAQMQAASTFLSAGWDFIGETKNGTEDIWWIDEGKDYPRLWWQVAPAEIRNSKP
jgi:hypothetical protein